MNKADVINAIAKQTGISKKDVTTVLDTFLQSIQDTLCKGKSITLQGFGKFANKKRAGKIARNLSDNTAIFLKERYVPALKPSRAFEERVKKSIQPEMDDL